MTFSVDNLKELNFVCNDYFNYEDFEVTALNYEVDKAKIGLYGCENSHKGAEAALLMDGSSYNPNDGRFNMQGIVVYVCPRCKKPVFEDDSHAG